MAFNFKSDQEELALTGDDVDAYPQMGIINRSRFISYDTYPVRIGRSDIRATSTGNSGQPLTADNLQQLADALEPIEGRGYWYIRWCENKRTPQDVDLDYDFRGVVAFGTLNFSIRPVQNDAEAPRLR